jgi:hypothetical protein
MRANFERYVDQITQNACYGASKYLENLNWDQIQSYRPVKIEKSRRVVESRPVYLDLW